jgi:hypothetical protein
MLGWLEDRTLLASLGGGASVVDVAAAAVPLALGSALAGTIGPLGTTYYEVSSTDGGELTVTLEGAEFPARVSLVDKTGQPLVQSDGPVAGGSVYVINMHVPARDDYLEVQSLGGGGAYQITADVIATNPAFENLPISFNGNFPFAIGDLGGNGIQDLVTPDGIHLGVGDGTFESAAVSGPLGDTDWNVTAIAVGYFSGGGLPDIAFAEISPGGRTAKVCVLQNDGDDQFQPPETFDIDPDPIAIQAIDLGNGVIDLAVADQSTGHVTILAGDGKGGFSFGPVLNGGSSPVAMAAGQLDLGYSDLIVANQANPDTGLGQGLSIFQYDGAGGFELAATIPLASAPQALVAGDFGNGHLDLAIANFIDNDITVLLGNGDGTFQSIPSTYAVGSDPVAIVATSLRDDGRLDLVTANQNSDDISVLLGNGDGTFGPQVRYQAGSAPVALVAGDYSGDGRPDLAIADSATSDIAVLIGRGDGTFDDQGRNPVGNGPIGAVTADLNHDGHVDIISTNTYSNNISVLMGNGDGTFQGAESFPAGEGPTALAVGDFNGDGRLDVAVADSGNGDIAHEGVSILLGNGDGTFQAPVFRTTAGSYPASIAVGDFTGDGVLDLAVANSFSDDVSILLGDGLGGFPTELTVPLGNQASEPVSIVAGDFTGDGLLDLAVLNLRTNNVSILQGDGEGVFQSMTRPITLDVPMDTAQAMTAGDFTGDGSLDLAVASAGFGGPDHVSILLNEGRGAFDVSPPIPFGPGLNPTSIIAARLLGDGALDLAIADQATDAVSVFRGNGRGGFTPDSTLELASTGFPIVVTSGDFTGDGELDLAIASQNPDSVAIELNQGNGQFALPSAVGLVPRNTPVVADFTGDGVPDVAIVDGSGDILFRQGLANQPGNFRPPITINPGFPSRDIAAVVTSQGVLLASVDENDDTLLWFTNQNGHFQRTGTLATGLEPAQIVAADLDGNGNDDMIIRNAGDGTLTIYMSNPLAGGFMPPITFAVGTGVSNVAVADVNQDGRLDILLANQTSGEVDVVLNRGDGSLGQPTLYRAGTGLSAVIGKTGATPVSLVSQDGTVGVAAAALAPGGPLDIVALNAGANTLGILTGLGGGRFANPYSLPMTGSPLAVRIADFNGDGNSDLAILGPDGVSVWLGNGEGSFVQGAPYKAGTGPTGLTVADINGDKLPDLLVGNAFGDVYVLLEEGNGIFHPPTITDQTVALAVTHPNGSTTPTFIFSDQSSDSVVVLSGSQPAAVVGDRTSGLRVPGAPVLADLNGDGVPDLIVANTGGNNVLVYPGLPGGGFGQALNDGNGFFTGTNPVAVIVANLNGRPDLIVANKGSNDVSILLNEPQGNSFTFVPGPRLSVGEGPVGLLYGDFSNNRANELVVSDSGSNNLMVLPSLGNGFFDDANPTIIALDESPGPIFAGSFAAGIGMDIVALDSETSNVTLISGLSTGLPTAQDFSSGGVNPVAAFAVSGLNGFDDLVVANNADGRVALLAGGPQGLTLEQVDDSLDPLGPTGLAPGSIQNNVLEFYVATAGEQAATLLGFSLGGLGGSSSITGGQALTLLRQSDSSLPLIATLLTPLVNLNATEEEPGASPAETVAVVAPTSTATSLGQGLFSRAVGDGDSGDGDLPTEPAALTPAVSEKAGLSPWKRIEIGLDEAFEEFRRAAQRKAPHPDGPAADDENVLPTPPAAPPVRARPNGESNQSAIVDAAIKSLVARDVRTPMKLASWFADPERMPHNRLEPGTLTAAALVLLLAGRRCAGRSDWRASQNNKPGQIPQEHA